MAQGYAVENFFERPDELEALGRGERARDDLRLCAVCMQWACNNPECRSERQCDLQVKTQAVGFRAVTAK